MNYNGWIKKLEYWSKEVGGVDCPTGKSLPLVVSRYRKNMFEKGCGWAEYSELEQVYKSGDKTRLYDFLQNMFLEIIEYENYEEALKRLNHENLREFYDLHMENKTSLMWNIILRMS